MNMQYSYLMAAVQALVGSAVATEAPPAVQEINAAQIRPKAEAGDLRAQRRMGILHLAGAGGVEKSREECFRWLRKAVAQGDACSKMILGLRQVFDERSWFVSLENGKVQCGVKYHVDREADQEDFIETNANRDECREGMEMLRSHMEDGAENRFFVMVGLLFDCDRDSREHGWAVIDRLRKEPVEEMKVMAALFSGMVSITSQYPDLKQRGTMCWRRLWRLSVTVIRSRKLSRPWRRCSAATGSSSESCWRRRIGIGRFPSVLQKDAARCGQRLF